jgi:diguanylate cyclase (GGDEF)-like protein
MVKALIIISYFFTAFFAVGSVVSQDNQSQPVYSVAIEADDVVSRVIFNAASYRFHFQVNYVTFSSFSEILTALAQGNVDFAANITFTDERAQQFDFSSPTNIEYTYLYSRNHQHLSTVSRLGVPSGTIYADLIRHRFPHIHLVEYLGQNDALRLLDRGEVDAVVDAINQLKPMLINGYSAQLLNDQIPIQPVSIATPKNRHTALLKNIEAFSHTAEMQQQLTRSIKRYQFDIRQQAIRQAVRQSGLDLNRTYQVKIENLNPYMVYLPDGKVTGIGVEVAFQACEILLIKCHLASHKDETWEQMYDDLLNQKIDILTPLVISSERQKLFYFSDSYHHPETILVKREGYKSNVYSNISELVVERIGVIKGDYFETHLGTLLPNKALIAYSNQDDQIAALLDNKVDYIVLGRANYNQMLRNADRTFAIEEEKSIGSFHAAEVAIGFAKNNVGAILAPLFTQAIKMINVGEIALVYDSQPDWRATLIAEKRFSATIRWTLIFLLVLVVAVAYYLHIQSNTDNLTKLQNRRSLYRRYSKGLPEKVSLVYLDVNRFKPINDTFGHEIGDKVLIQIAERIATVWPARSYRIGGDEFILVGEVEEDKLLNVIAKLKSFLFVDIERDVSFNISLSVGVSRRRDHCMSLQDVMHRTDIAMYRAKSRSHISVNSGECEIVDDTDLKVVANR